MSQLHGFALWVVMVVGSSTVVGCESTSAMLGNYEVVGQGGDGQTGAPTGGQAFGADLGRGVPSFGAPVAIASLIASGYTTTDPTVTGDGLELFFMSTRSGNKELWHVRRSRLTVDWPPPKLVAATRTGSTESNPKISEDGLRLWFYSDRDRAKGTLWETQRAALTEEFLSPTIVPVPLLTGISEVAGCPNRDGTIAIVSAIIEKLTDGYDLLEIRRSSTEQGFGKRVILKNVNSSEDDYDPWLSSDGRLLLFHSNRFGGDDLFWSMRPTVNDDFGVPLAFSALNTAKYDEASPTLIRDRSRIWFASTRDGEEQIYEAVALE